MITTSMGDSDSQKLLQDDEEFEPDEGSQENSRDMFGLSSNLQTEAAAFVPGTISTG